MDIQGLFVIFLAVVMVIFVLSRFSGGSYGQLRPNGEVGEAFETFRLRDNLQYYISGSDVCPNAIMGLDRTWVLRDDVWKRRELTTAVLQELVTGMQQRHQPLHGFDMVDHRGRKMGEWFSVLDSQTTIKVVGEKTVWVSTPPSADA